MSPSANFNYPSSYRLGCGRRRELSDVCAEFSLRRPLVVTDGGVARLPWFSPLISELRQAGLSVSLHDDVEPNPTGNDVARGVALYRKSRSDGVILLGGGSPLDVGKCIALLADNPGDVFDYEDVGDNYKKADPDKIATMIAMPTTSGTGSEVGRAAVIINEAKQKKIIFHPKMQPPVVLADPELTFGLPPHLTAFTGLDAFTHAFEAYCAPGYHPMADGIALEAMRLIREWLPLAVEQGDHAEARTQMMMASSMGATAFQKGLGIVHAIAHALGGSYGVHHGMANALLLPYCMHFNRSAIEERCAVAARHMNLGGGGGFDALLSWVIDLRARFGVPNSLSELEGLSEAGALGLSSAALGDPTMATNPKAATPDEMRHLLRRAYHGQLSSDV